MGFGGVRTAHCHMTLGIVVGSLISGAAAGAQAPIALVPVDAARDGGVKVAGAIEVSGGHAIISNSGSVTAGDRTALVSLPGRGELRVCSTTTIHLSRDRSVNASGPPIAAGVAGSAGSGTQGSGMAGSGSSGSAPAAGSSPATAAASAASSGAGALMIALDRGALEANYATGRYSDVLMTPDFRILISGPGQADLRVRVSAQGDTCVENAGEHAPYVTVASQLEDGLYRVQPGQRVLFEHGSLREVVDHEKEPCGCPPPPLAVASGSSPAGSGLAFPLAQSEGLAPAPPPPTQPVVPPGETHTQVTVPLVYNGNAPAKLTPPPADAPTTPPEATPTSPVSPPAPKPASGGFFHKIGHFFSRLFGR